ncbi:hypothetical protein [Glutamicibacter arilaitensis]|uniref:hypothetical protein n=1 Tax=Glutamicibacter arilaitensis TaxID=256701 RepID=UPI003A8E2ADF
MDDAQRAELVNTVTGALDGVIEPVLSNAIDYWKNIDAAPVRRSGTPVQAIKNASLAAGVFSSGLRNPRRYPR